MDKCLDLAGFDSFACLTQKANMVLPNLPVSELYFSVQIWLITEPLQAKHVKEKHAKFEPKSSIKSWESQTKGQQFYS